MKHRTEIEYGKKNNPILRTGSTEILQRWSLDNKIFFAYDEDFEKKRIVWDKSLSNAWRFAVLDRSFMENYRHLIQISKTLEVEFVKNIKFLQVFLYLMSHFRSMRNCRLANYKNE